MTQPYKPRPDAYATLLRLIGSLTLCDHMGDVSDAVTKALDDIGLTLEWDEWAELGVLLHKMGVTTLYGTSLAAEETGMADE